MPNPNHAATKKDKNGDSSFYWRLTYLPLLSNTKPPSSQTFSFFFRESASFGIFFLPCPHRGQQQTPVKSCGCPSRRRGFLLWNRRGKKPLPFFFCPYIFPKRANRFKFGSSIATVKYGEEKKTLENPFKNASFFLFLNFLSKIYYLP